MSRGVRRWQMVVGLLVLLALVLGACAPAATSTPAAAEGGNEAQPTQAAAPTEAVSAPTEAAEAAPTEAAAPAEGGEAAGGSFDVAFLNGTNDNGWRILMEEQMQQVADEYKAAGLIAKYTAYSANNDATTQAQQMEQLINAGTDLILINPVSTTSLNPVIDKAVEKGIVVMGVDQTIDHPDVISVTTNQKQWARIQVEWLVEQLGGKGDILMFNAIAGAPANEERLEVFREVLAQNPDIKVLKEVNHDWDVGKAKQLMTSLLPAYPEFDAVLTQECSPGILQALMEAGHEMPQAITSDEQVLYLRMWREWNQQHPDDPINAIIVENPPGIGATGLRIGMSLLQGKTLKGDIMTGNSVLIDPQVVITNENMEEWYENTKDLPETTWFSSVLPQDKVDALFQ